jgi:hypothetical protein
MTKHNRKVPRRTFLKTAGAAAIQTFQQQSTHETITLDNTRIRK